MDRKTTFHYFQVHSIGKLPPAIMRLIFAYLMTGDGSIWMKSRITKIKYGDRPYSQISWENIEAISTYKRKKYLKAISIVASEKYRACRFDFTDETFIIFQKQSECHDNICIKCFYNECGLFKNYPLYKHYIMDSKYNNKCTINEKFEMISDHYSFMADFRDKSPQNHKLILFGKYFDFHGNWSMFFYFL